MKGIIEEALLLLIAAGMLSFLMPASTAWGLALSVTLASALILLLLLRGIGWHTRATPYDVLIIAGAAVSLIYLASFSALLSGVLSVILAVLFTFYFLLLATLLHNYRTVSASVAHDHGRTFMRGIKPIPEHEPPFADLTKKQAAAHAHMARHGIEPIHEMTPPKPAKTHSKSFSKGIKPIKESKKLPWEN